MGDNQIYFRYDTGGSAPSPLHLFLHGAKFITERDPVKHNGLEHSEIN